jgi:hypothetical protein
VRDRRKISTDHLYKIGVGESNGDVISAVGRHLAAETISGQILLAVLIHLRLHSPGVVTRTSAFLLYLMQYVGIVFVCCKYVFIAHHIVLLYVLYLQNTFSLISVFLATHPLKYATCVYIINCSLHTCLPCGKIWHQSI